MKAIHLICKFESGSPRGVFLIDKEMRHWSSGMWDISTKDADLLVGGSLYLHETKGGLSYFGGKILGYEATTDETLGHAKRITFRFESIEGLKNKSWRGKDHSMAWTSGVIDED